MHVILRTSCTEGVDYFNFHVVDKEAINTEECFNSASVNT